MHKVGILRDSLNPIEGQCFEKLPKYGFQPVGITTYDNAYNSEIHFPIRVGHNFNTLTKGKFQLKPGKGILGRLTGLETLKQSRPIQLLPITKYFESCNLQIFDLKKLTVDLDIIYSADVWYPYTYQALKTGLPTIVMEWENLPFSYEYFPYSRIKKYNRKHATHFVAITEKAKDALVIEGVDPDRISVLPAGIDCETFKPAERNAQFAKK
jgi:glycosyltransferase involved in cell wall biosynthesis